ncbi:LacI family transcriptional regulator [Arcicella rosea]|uniref:LacI family DNA-binding transcriptional regulator n=1 Tax=Arcicella rosea TaxID=502909 RepID=UPI00345D0FD7
MEHITIKDIAKALNLSTSTVSRALRGSHEINPDTKRSVMEYAEKFNYQPNPIALSLKENKSRSIGVIVPEIDNPFFSQAINGIEDIAYNKGYQVVIFQSHESYEREVINTQHITSRRVDGLLISLSGQTTNVDHLKNLHDKGLPIVLFDRISDEIDTHKVISDNFEGSFNGTEHLIKTGRKRIAHIAASPHLSISKERVKGYLAALAKHNIPVDESLLKYCNYGLQDIEVVIDQLFSNETPPDAIFTASDRLALGCLSTLKKRNIKVPEDIALIGFTNLKVAALLAPSLSTIVQPALDMGKRSAELLFDLIENTSKLPKSYRTFKLYTELIVRNSSVMKSNEE